MRAAIHVMHDDPARRWTIQQLAKRAGMSRSAFASAFVGVLGKSPMRYLAEVRMDRAAHLLGTQGATLGDAAAEAGYTTTIAFTRAFKRHFGITPENVAKAALSKLGKT